MFKRKRRSEIKLEEVYEFITHQPLDENPIILAWHPRALIRARRRRLWGSWRGWLGVINLSWRLRIYFVWNSLNFQICTSCLALPTFFQHSSIRLQNLSPICSFHLARSAEAFRKVCQQTQIESQVGRLFGKPSQGKAPKWMFSKA